LLGFQLPQFDDFARLGPWDRTRFGHAGILAGWLNRSKSKGAG
jgi:hypothetical protein